MKKLLSAVLAPLLCAALLVPARAAETQTVPAAATNNTVVVSNSADTPDAHIVTPAVYKIGGANYFKLRDLAMLLSGSAKQFAVDYDDVSKSVSITSGRPYEPIGGELSGTAEEKTDAIVSNNAIRINGESVTLTVYKIDGANYFKLRDLGKLLDFHVGYDGETKTVFLSGARGYEGENADAVPHSAQAVRTNGFPDGVRYPVLTLIRSAEELRRYEEDNRGIYDLSSKGSADGFADAAAAYDGEWFGEHQLLIVVLEESSGSFRPEVTNVTAGADPAVEIDILMPEVYTADMAVWHVLIETGRVFDSADGITVRITPKKAD